MEEIEKVRLGVIGVGRIGKVHIENLVNRIPAVEVLEVADVDMDEAGRVAGKYRIPSHSTNHRNIMDRSDIDAIVICSSTDSHAQLIEEGAAAGKAVFCEKPIDLSLERIHKTLAVVKDSGVKLQIGFNRRFDANFSKAQEMVATGKIGQPHVLRITSRDPAPPPKDYILSSGGIFLDMTIHDFDMTRFLLRSEVKEVYARGEVLVDPVFKEADDWDTAVITLSFDNGAVGLIDNSRRAVYGYDQRVEVFGSDGMVTVGNETQDSHTYLDAGGDHSALPQYFFLERYMDSYREEMNAFIDSVRNDTDPPVTGHDGLMAVIIGLAAKKSAHENRPVAIEEILSHS